MSRSNSLMALKLLDSNITDIITSGRLPAISTETSILVSNPPRPFTMDHLDADYKHTSIIGKDKMFHILWLGYHMRSKFESKENPKFISVLHG